VYKIGMHICGTWQMWLNDYAWPPDYMSAPTGGDVAYFQIILAILLLYYS